MSLDRIKGQDSAVGALSAALSSGRVPGALLFAGPSGVGKSLAAYEVAKALLCRKGPVSACEKCPSCRRVDSRTHNDLFPLTIQPEYSTITVDDVRGLCGFIMCTPLESERKVAVIDPADAMTEEAQNAFLKTLEEPPADTTIILVAVSTDMLLPTVRSRCRRVNFGRVSDEIVAAFLREKGVSEKDAALLARLADGSFGAALALAGAGDAPVRAEFLQAVLSAGPGGVQAIAAMLTGEPSGGGKKARKERRRDAAALLVALHSVLVDGLRVKSGAAVRTNLDLAAAIERFAGSRDFDALAALEKEASDAIIVLGNYSDLRLVATRLAAAFTRSHRAEQVEAP